MLAYAILSIPLTWPAHILPLIIGIVLLRTLRDSPLSGLLGLFTLKPLLATPLWASLLYVVEDSSGLLHGPLGPLITLLPGIGLTLLILLNQRRNLRYAGWLLIPILVLDALRWINSFLYALNQLSLQWHYPYGLTVGLFMPNLFAVMALAMALWSPHGYAAGPRPASPAR
jgi:hypothetical protein